MNLIEEANKIYQNNFDNTTCFERAVFFSWGCNINDCTFCYMSTQPKNKLTRQTRRSTASLLAEFILIKNLGWQTGFFSGGIGAFTPLEMEELLKTIYNIVGKIWLNIGPVPKVVLEKYKPYIKGVVGSIETINPKLHKQVCPSKPIPPYEKMFEVATNLGLEKGMTFIVGLGEKKKDFELLEKFIKKHRITKIHVYGLNPQKGTEFENSQGPNKEEQVWWIAKLRTTFPKLDIQCGIWENRINWVSNLLEAGANSISKFRATHLFGTAKAKEIEKQSTDAGRNFIGTLSILPKINWDLKIDNLPITNELKEMTKEKLKQYLHRMEKNIKLE